MLARRGESATPAADDERLRSAYEAHLLKTKHLLTHRPQFTALHLTYADLLETPAGAAHTIGAFLGTGLHIDQMAGVIDQALYRNRAGREVAHPAPPDVGCGPAASSTDTGLRQKPPR